MLPIAGSRAVPIPMSKLLFSALLALVLALPALADASTGPLQITPADGWTVKYDATAQSYSVVPPAGPAQNTLLSFTPWPAPGTPAEIPGFLDTMAAKFADMAQHNPKIKLASPQYTKGEFIGDPYSGNYVEFTIKGGLKQVLFIFGDSTGLWNGQYIGTADGWFDAMEVLKGIKKT
jgi:hypothetical protein